jgi:hypothetical protein
MSRTAQFTPINRACHRARALCDHLVIAEHHETYAQPQHAALAMDDARLWLKLTAEALGYQLVKAEQPRDAVDRTFARVNALALAVRA